MKFIFTPLAFIIAALSISAPVDAAKLYKWVDKKGNISYQDTPPPRNAKVLEESSFERETSSAIQPSSGTEVTVYTVEDCSPCQSLLQRLDDLDVPYQVKSLLNKDIQSEILSNQDSIIAPTLKIGDTYIQNLTEESIIESLQLEGLTPQLASDDVSAPEESLSDTTTLNPE